MDEKRKRGANAILVIPLIAATAAASRLGGGRVRTVDFVQIFASGALVGVVLMRIIQLILDKKKPAA
jgi:hypothetical protein